MKIFSALSTADYKLPGHPESPERIRRSHEYLTAAGLTPIPPTVEAGEADVLTVHTQAHWDAVKSGNHDDADTPHFPGIERIALTSLSGALSACESAIAGEPAFSLMRPPGHHAGKERIAGFCYVNNLAAACRRAITKGIKVAVLDVDVHHGDGTQNIAYRQDNWLFVSLHQSPLYPGSGLESRDNCFNFPLRPYTGEEEYLQIFETAIGKVMDFKPQLLAVSAGFDTYKNDPLAQMKLVKKTYKTMGRMMADTGLNRFAVLEGGYAEDLPSLIENFLVGFAG